MIIQSIQKLLQYDLIKNNCYIINHCSKDLTIDFYPYQFQQIILNLLYNALESHADTITIETNSDAEKKEIFIINNGNPIPPNIQRNIFDPFYTTKENGTGLGLAICREILHQHSHNLELVKSNENSTIFKITLLKNSDLKSFMKI